MKDDRLYLIHILECIQRVRRYTSGGEDEFMGNEMIQDAVNRNLQIMAESTQRLSEATRAKHSQVPWREIAGFRNVLAHDYLGVTLDRVWSIVAHSLEPLEQAIKAICDKLPANH